MRRIILFGAGRNGKSAYDDLKEDYEIVAFADNNEEKIGNQYCGVPIISAYDIVQYMTDDSEVIICARDYVTIIHQLEELGIKNYEIILRGRVYSKKDINFYSEYRRCNRCIMDNSSDDMIFFDENGRCNYCNSALKMYAKTYFPNAEGKRKLDQLIGIIKDCNREKKYDCIMGLSGGLDSSYLAYLGYRLGLRVLAVHIDDGYDTAISKSNLEKLIHATGFDYEVICPDCAQYNDLVLSYMKAGVPNIAVPQDNVLFAFLYKKMKEYRIDYFLSGGNFALECILQAGNTYSAYDLDNLYAIHRRFGKKSIDKLEFISLEQRDNDKNSLGLKTVRPLDYIDYNRDRAFQELKDFCGFEYYGRKHLENILTAFIQLYWFPQKFGVDKRTSHLSSMIISGQLTRDDAMKLMEEPLYNPVLMDQYIDQIKKNMDINDDEFEAIMLAPVHRHEEYTL